MVLKLVVPVTAALLVTAGPAAAAELPAALVDPYLQVHAALAGDQVAGVAAPARAIETAATALGTPAAALAAAARSLAAATDLAAARTAFGDLSTALAAYTDATKSTFGPNVRLAYCPMVNKPWLQKDKEIRNPYYGAAMLGCGTFRN